MKVVIMRKNRSAEIDMCSGAIIPKMLLFTLPLMASSILQLLFNAADLVVVGKFGGETGSLQQAAVSSTGSLVNLIINLFLGLSVGVNVVVARFYGAQDTEGIRDTVHTSMLISLIGGIFVAIFGFFMAEPLLVLMKTAPDVLPLAVLYLRIYFLGMPFCMVYNFGSAILRAVGDTRRPLVFLFIAGVINVVLNLVTVIGFRMGVAGVAIATAASQIVSSVLVVICLMRSDTDIRFFPRLMRIHRDKLGMIVTVGLPAGLQSTLFSLSNVIIQSGVNSFGSTVVAGNGDASNIEGFVYAAMNSFYHAAITFTSQNFGAKQYKRINKILVSSLILVVATGLLFGLSATFFGEQLLGIYSNSPDDIAAGIIRLNIICPLYFLCGMMDVMVGMMRGIGCSVVPMIVSLCGACGFRIVWIYTAFAAYHTQKCLYMSYPLSWFLTFSVHLICYFIVKKRIEKRISAQENRIPANF